MITLFKCSVIRSGPTMTVKHEVGKITGIVLIDWQAVGAGGVLRPVATGDDGKTYILNG